jgi:cathepsin A (carboxypeptidase C)
MVGIVSLLILASQLAWLGGSAVGATQLPLVPPATGANPFESTTSSTQDFPSLQSLTTDEFTTFKHPSYPHHALRIKEAPDDWCDPSVKKYTGYIDISLVRHLFFYFFESRNDPEKDDVMLWTNGGPGGSSSLGLFMELGPCTLVRKNHGKGREGEIRTMLNQYSWNELANMFFIDQPAG